MWLAGASRVSLLRTVCLVALPKLPLQSPVSVDSFALCFRSSLWSFQFLSYRSFDHFSDYIFDPCHCKHYNSAKIAYLYIL